MKSSVCVTGAGGFIASHLVKGLIERGYKVRGTVRNLHDASKVSHLRTLFPSLELFEADLLKEGSFDDAIKGCSFVFHTASPFVIEGVKDAQKELVDPALKGTLNVLNSVERSGTVQRIVLTSSIAAITSKKPEGYIFTEEDWNYESSVTQDAYRFSKRIAEESAWNFVKGKKYDLVAINPASVLGPPLSSRVDATSVGVIKNYLEGKDVRPFGFGVVDVRDVALAHILAAEKKEAHGRYLLTSEIQYAHFEYCQWLIESGKFKDYPVTVNGVNPLKPLESRPQIYSNKKAREELGLEFTPVKKSVLDMAEALVKLGIVSPKK